ncbi:hypothetical protein [Ochrobactrum sp. BTU1]|uniref:hypothetical protein n=1 Tax=Ochrobactrum sp. BTU1 TaxID=2840456 RepID=UPI001C041949|nr:hypothetical protein KMS41_16305 [Ochrobactrum sp. BTU1]
MSWYGWHSTVKVLVEPALLTNGRSIKPMMMSECAVGYASKVRPQIDLSSI